MLEPVLTTLFAILAAVHIVAIALFFLPSKASKKKYCPPVSVIIPAHNEERYIAGTIRSVLDADYDNKKEIVVVDDGSIDGTKAIVRNIANKNRNVRLYSTPHSGKAKALNYGIARASFETVACIDADSSIGKQSLLALVRPLSEPGIAASSGVIRVKYNGIFTWFQDIDYIVSSGWRYISGKLNSTYVTPGFAAFKKSVLKKIDCFSSDTLTEDIDVAIRLRKAGFSAAMSPAVIFTSVPSSFLGLLRQRLRWGRGSVQVAKKHSDILFTKKLSFVGSYALPMHLFWYVFALAYIPFAAYWFLGSFLSAPISLASLGLLAKWFTIYGIADLHYSVLSGAYALTPLIAAIIASWLSSLFYLLISMWKFGFTWRTLVAYIFVFPYYWLLLAIQAIALVSETFSRKGAKNRWAKLGGN